MECFFSVFNVIERVPDTTEKRTKKVETQNAANKNTIDRLKVKSWIVIIHGFNVGLPDFEENDLHENF